MILKIQQYDFDLIYVKGSEMYLADTLSRANLSETDGKLIDEICVHKVSMSPERQAEMEKATESELCELMYLIENGWPEEKSEVSVEARSFFHIRDELTVEDSLVYRGNRLVVPLSLRRYVLQSAHEGHLGMNRCKQRAREACFWPGMNAELETLLQNCAVCQTSQSALPKQKMVLREVPEMPWQNIGSDIFQFGKDHYVIVVDYYSKWIATKKLNDLSANGLINALLCIFYIHGFPSQITSDNGPQYASDHFRKFCSQHSITHRTTSPYYAQSNGAAERAIQTTKKLWIKNQDKGKALFLYNSTTVPSIGLSPSQMLMSRRLRTDLPIQNDRLKPSVPRNVQSKLQEIQKRQKHYYDRNAREPYQPLKAGDQVLIQPTDQLKPKRFWEKGTVVARHDAPNSYIIGTDTNRNIRRNRRHLRRCPKQFQSERPITSDHNPSTSVQNQETPAQDEPNVPQVDRKGNSPKQARPVSKQLVTNRQDTNKNSTRSGRTVNRPSKFADYVVY
jgi:transposase InsO family protein